MEERITILFVVGAMLLGFAKRDWQAAVSGMMAGALVLYAGQADSASPVIDPPNGAEAKGAFFLSFIAFTWFVARLLAIVSGMTTETKAK